MKAQGLKKLLVMINKLNFYFLLIFFFFFGIERGA
jgi:hypothetical protein